ncbi:thiopeptide-type bacteriocin biosynthesis protein [Ktedonospora formicarum]|uniref:thiopeptide-type bacteriocin biosynthesis protein n=1 Tax=Ktedonospora formicarum TaxID=2778364 RepID=UPI001F18036B|nr:thiopeptide-type bacteriocin biosynthesis protein [Ktedonospora formicarum]
MLHALLVWSHERQAEGLLLRSTLDTYERETERYGGPEAISAIESVFCAQSEAACALLLQQKQASPLLFEAVYALDYLWTDWGYDLSTRYQLVQRRFSPYKEPPALREQRKPLLAFLSNPPEHTKATFEHQRSVISQTAQTISHLAQCEALCRHEEDILWSLSHMSCNRLLGTKRAYEQDAYRLWVIALKTRYHTA